MTRIRTLCGIVAGLTIAMSGALTAQTLSAPTQIDSPIAAVANAKPWEYGALVQGGVGLEERTDFSFFMVGGHLGKVLTPQLGKGRLQGNIEYSVEVFPLWQSYTPKFQRISCTGGRLIARSAARPIPSAEPIPASASRLSRCAGTSPTASGSCRGCRPRAASCGRTTNIPRLATSIPTTQPRRAPQPIPACGTSRRRVESVPITF